MTAARWLRAADPPVPDEFHRWLSKAPPPDTEGARLPPAPWLERAARDALARALAPEGRERDGAFDLLAADAFVTWAAEAALAGEDPDRRLRQLAGRIARAPGGA